jgi:adenosine deaminase
VQVVDPVPSLMAFIAKFDLPLRVLVDYEAVRRVARENLEDAVCEGIDYLELRFSPFFMCERHPLDTVGVTEAVCDGLEEGLAELPVRAKLIVTMSRTYGPDNAAKELEAAIRCRDRGVVAVDLAGDEASFPGELFGDHFRRAREAGLRAVAHAGEVAGPDSVRQAVLGLGVDRIGHGIRAVEDRATVELLVERAVCLEVCPTSNLHTSTVAAYSAHPLRRLLTMGVRATLNTDDPGISGIDLAHEYRIAEEELGLSDVQIDELRWNAVEAAFLSPEERAELIAEAGSGTERAEGGR